MKSKNIFWRTVFLSGVIFFNLILLVTGISTAYENIKMVFFGEYEEAIEITENEIKILDFYISKAFEG